MNETAPRQPLGSERSRAVARAKHRVSSETPAMASAAIPAASRMLKNRSTAACWVDAGETVPVRQARPRSPPGISGSRTTEFLAYE